MWSAIHWSYSLLSEGEKALFRRMSVFIGGWTLEAASEVVAGHQYGDIGLEINRNDVPDLLSFLVEKSVVTLGQPHGKARYRCLEMVRQFAVSKLEESGEEIAARTAHKNFYSSFAARAEPELCGPDQLQWFENIEGELDNIRSIFQWSARRGEYEACLHIAGSLWWSGLREAIISKGKR